MAQKINIVGTLHDNSVEHIVANADEVYDLQLSKKQNEINANTAIYNVSAANRGSAFTLESAIAAIPEPIRKGGLIISFIEETKKDVAIYKLSSATWSEDTKNWDKYPNSTFDTEEYVYVLTDTDDKIIIAVDKNGDVKFGAGVPRQIVDYINTTLIKSDSSDKINHLDDIIAFLSGFTKSDTLADELNVIKENTYIKDSETNEVVKHSDLIAIESDNPEFVYVIIDSNKKILGGFRHDGDFVFGAGVPKQITDEITRLFGQYSTANAIEIETNDDNISAYIGKNGNIDADINDSTGDLNLYFDSDNIDIKNGYELENGDLVVETNKVITL